MGKIKLAPLFGKMDGKGLPKLRDLANGKV
jgi:hypothetical protein